jgi:hypothetical protein
MEAAKTRGNWKDSRRQLSGAAIEAAWAAQASHARQDTAQVLNEAIAYFFFSPA